MKYLISQIHSQKREHYLPCQYMHNPNPSHLHLPVSIPHLHKSVIYDIKRCLRYVFCIIFCISYSILTRTALCCCLFLSLPFFTFLLFEHPVIINAEQIKVIIIKQYFFLCIFFLTFLHKYPSIQ